MCHLIKDLLEVIMCHLIKDLLEVQDDEIRLYTTV